MNATHTAADAAHQELWSCYREAILRDEWAYRTSGIRDAVSIVIAGSLTCDGVDVATVVRRADVRAALDAIRPEALGYATVEHIFAKAIEGPTTMVIAVAGASRLADVIFAEAGFPFTGPGGEA